jgi:hypothetical protein
MTMAANAPTMPMVTDSSTGTGMVQLSGKICNCGCAPAATSR